MGKLSGALKLHCPRCEKAPLYKAKNPYAPGKMLSMFSHCSNCGLRFEKEAGFFYGAMYVSYMINIAFFVTITVAWYVFINGMIDWRLYIGSYVLLTILLIPVIYRYSRAIWLMFMVKYEPEKRGER